MMYERATFDVDFISVSLTRKSGLVEHHLSTRGLVLVFGYVARYIF